jgi:hypothetical protein
MSGGVFFAGAMKVHRSELVAVGDDTGLVLGPECLASLGAALGDTVMLNETPQGFVIARVQPAPTHRRRVANQRCSARRFLSAQHLNE